MKLIAKFDGNTVRVYNDSKLYGSMDFSRERKFEADIFVYESRFRIAPASASDKNLAVTKGDEEIFKFGFDYVWGGAEIQSQGEPTGYEVKGRWFKPGTRLVDENDKDLVIVKTVGKELEIEVADESLEPVMVLSTTYYHIYASNAATLGLIVAFRAKA